MPDEVEELISEIALKHGIAVSRDDPIFVLQTLNQRLMVDSAKAQREMLQEYKAELEATARMWGNDAKDKAERVLNAAMKASREAVATIMEKAATATSASVRGEIDLTLGRVARTLRQSHRIAAINLVASAFTLMAAGLAVWVTLHHY
jgi:hypothetical protein